MVQKKVALPGLGVAALLAGGLAGRQLISRWRQNPDPLDGEPVRFPTGDFALVTLPDGANISTMSVGTGPAIVCVHGLTASRHDWGPMAPALLAAGYRLVAVEQRGHGDSTPGTAGYGSTQLGDDLAVVFEELNIEAAALVGHSMGGMAAMAFAVNHVEALASRVDSLILIATAASLRTARYSLGLRVGALSIPEALQPTDRRLRVSTGLSIFGAKPSLHMIDEAIRSFRNCPESVRQQATAALMDHDVLDEIARIEVPALIIGGTRDQLIRPFQIEQLGNVMPQSEVHMLQGAGHMLIWERHKEIAELIVKFLG